ncbi:MAG: DUF6612 family protein [Bilifractor sp.]|nr:hypothetical protein [Lachnospiraceae bacterium]MDY2837405.1 DUF6612 family protein [Bilifractor sp.]
MRINKWKSVGISAATAVIVFSMSACAGAAPTAQSVAAGVEKSMGRVTSASENVEVDFSGSLAVSGVTADVSMHMESSVEETTDPFAAHANTEARLSVFGNSTKSKTENYMIMEDGQLITYSNADDSGWEKTTTKLKDSEKDKLMSLYNKDLYSKIADGSQEATLEEATENVNGKAAYILDTTLEGDLLKSLFLESVNSESSEEALKLDEINWEDLSSDVRIYIYKETKQPAKLEMDASKIGESYMKQLLALSAGDDTMDLDVNSFDVNITFDKYNKVEEITIPNEAMKAEESADDNPGSLLDELGRDDSGSGGTTSASSSDTEPAPAESTSPTVDSSQQAPANLGTSDWTGMAFALNGDAYQIPFAYADLVSHGWTLGKESGLTEGYVLNPGDKLTALADLKNEAYDGDFEFTVGFANTGDSVQDVTKCSIWSVSMRTEYCKTDSYPSLELPGGITWGSTAEDVVKAYGEPHDEPYRSDDFGYSVYDYQTDDFNCYLKLSIYDNGGVKEVSLQNYLN